MKISLIGMSGSGKSYWSKKLEKKGFKRFCVDDLLEEKLKAGLQSLGYHGIHDLSKWMRQPYEARYASTSKTYLDYEKKVMLEVYDSLEKQGEEVDNIVVDTTGSVIYLGPPILEKLSQLTRIIYLQTPKSVQKEMYDLYMSDPKPVIWGESFYKKKGETPIEALSRCYPELLLFRTKQYEKLANVSLDYALIRKKDFTLEKFIAKL